MYLDIIIIVILLLVAAFLFRRLSNFFYMFAAIDIFLRIITFLKYNIKVPELQSFLNECFSENVFEILAKYTNGVLYDCLVWTCVGFYVVFLGYIVSYIITGRK